ncbi:anti-sigma factor [Sulfitobacter albidus]|uniref:Anti-sigma factor n=1 Tax=Sulfitobacter albidus TaxID=2829501 RepID=A0A975JBD1_9RHOB|nr:anti-sigma factor [Sulfitobacter albidus]QUJ75359.1 anti-sigma factor [Sulfitobacter albidus]
MTETPDITPELPEDGDDLLAAELALRLLEGEEERDAAYRLTRDPAFADLVADWHERLIPLAAEFKEKAPPRRAKKRLTKRLFQQTRVPLGQRVWVWKSLAAAAFVAAAYLGVQQLAPAGPEGSDTVFATQLTGEAVPLQVLAVLDPDRGDVALSRVAGQEAVGRAFELWAIVPDQPPISLGVMSREERFRVPLPENLLARAGEITLAISDEPAGGSPTGAPTGAVLAAAPVTEL